MYQKGKNTHGHSAKRAAANNDDTFIQVKFYDVSVYDCLVNVLPEYL